MAFGNKGAESPSHRAARAAEARLASAKEAAATATARKSTGGTTVGGRDGDLAESGRALGTKRGRALAEMCVSEECRGLLSLRDLSHAVAARYFGRDLEFKRSWSRGMPIVPAVIAPQQKACTRPSPGVTTCFNVVRVVPVCPVRGGVTAR